MMTNFTMLLADLNNVATPIVELMNKILSPLIYIVGSVGAIWCVLLGVKLAKADEPQEREKAKMALRNAVVGYILIFALVVILRTSIGPLVEWMNKYQSTLPAASTSTTGAIQLLRDILSC